MLHNDRLPIVIDRISEIDQITDEVVEACERLSKELHHTNHIRVTRVRLQRVISNPGCYWLIARTLEGYIVGMVILQTYWVVTNARSMIDNLVVDPDYRRRGVGTALVNEVLEIGRDHGINKLRLHTAYDSPSAKLVEKLSFNRGPLIPYQFNLRGDE